jgi:hypothetical protein
MGFALPGFSGEGLGQDFAQPPLPRFLDPATNRRANRRPRVSISLRSAPSSNRAEARRSDRATLLGFLHRPILVHWNEGPSGL